MEGEAKNFFCSEDNDLIGQITNISDCKTLVKGIAHTPPMLVKLQTEIYHDGNVRIQIMREDIPVTKRLRMSFMLITDKEYMAGFK